MRLATLADVPTLNQLIEASVRQLSRAYYTPGELESALKYVFGVDTQLVQDGTYFVVEDGAGQPLGCGGWSRRATLFGGDQHKAAPDPLLRPEAGDLARIRAFFIHPRAARQGVGRQLLEASEAAAWAAGFQGFQLGATPSGVDFYRAHGYEVVEKITLTLPDGEAHPVVRMQKRLP